MTRNKFTSITIDSNVQNDKTSRVVTGQLIREMRRANAREIPITKDRQVA